MIFEDKSANDFLMPEGNADDYKSAIKHKIQEFADAMNRAKKDDAKKALPESISLNVPAKLKITTAVK
ncbi:hypothetical protein PCO85_09875 [Prodigiosinella aquatilis]|nr:hypothetical protein [Prodigiosinella sp. LS101]WJV55661.1 hypothetical protein PCO85_09875 [Prodigiosinella sp. LS101]WJV60022.1 hypothetical protein PCO84_09880 [Pectobacteriaceae bacterium C111]